MQGQWIGDIEGEVGGTLRVELERRGSVISGNGYLFYAPEHQLPGFKFLIRMPDTAPYKAEVTTIYCYPDGGIMSSDDRLRAEKIIAERFGEPPVPEKIDATFTEQLDGSLKVDWSGQEQFGSETLAASKATGDSLLVSRNDLKTWSDFRQWAIDQDPGKYIFRGSPIPSSLPLRFIEHGGVT